jgi:hypothetical protein
VSDLRLHHDCSRNTPPTTNTGSPQVQHTPQPYHAQPHELPTRSSKRYRHDDDRFGVESDCDWDEDDDLPPLLQRITYCDPFAKVGHNVKPARASNGDRTTRLLDQIQGLQIKLARSKKTAAHKVRCTRKLNTTTNDKNRHIERLNDQVQALQAQVTILQRKNNYLSVAATANKAEHDSAVHKLTADATREDEEKNEKDKKAPLYRRLLSYGAGRGKWKRIS